MWRGDQVDELVVVTRLTRASGLLCDSKAVGELEEEGVVKQVSGTGGEALAIARAHDEREGGEGGKAPGLVQPPALVEVAATLGVPQQAPQRDGAVGRVSALLPGAAGPGPHGTEAIGLEHGARLGRRKGDQSVELLGCRRAIRVVAFNVVAVG